jgi:outer membrane lipoprotein SlyB
MRTIVGIFNTRSDAERALEQLGAAGIPSNHVNLLLPWTAAEDLKSVETVEAEQPGIGGAIGGVVGGALGAATGMGLGAAAATMFLPGVGPVLVVGILGAALLGAGGAMGGVLAGEALEEKMAEGLPVDELFVYEDALSKGRSVIVVQSASDKQDDAVRSILEQAGAESVDSARENWWVGLRDAEEGEYKAQGLDFRTDESLYRQGFEAAQHPMTRGKPYDEALGHLTEQYPDSYSKEAFRHGFRRGQFYLLNLKNKPKERAKVEQQSSKPLSKTQHRRS